MPVEVQAINRSKMTWGMPYLTRNQIKPTGACDKCNLLIEKKEVRFAVLSSYGVRTYCNNCVTKVLAEIRKSITEDLYNLKKLDENKPYAYNYGGSSTVSNYIRAGAYLALGTSIGMYKQVCPDKKVPDRIEAPSECSVCKKVGFIEKRNEKQRYDVPGSSHWNSNPLLTDVNREYSNRINFGAPPHSFCKEHAIVEVEKILDLYREFESEIENHFDVNKPHSLQFPTQGDILSEEGISLENVKTTHRCYNCSERLQKSCIRLNDYYNDRGNYLCIKCGDEYLRVRIAAMTKILETIEQIKQERCKTCPREVNVLCLTRGINLPSNILEGKE
jgi:hypothetical protein